MPFCLEEAHAADGRALRQISFIDVNCIRTNGWMRTRVGDVSGLKESIRRVGLLAPLLVRPVMGGYELISGARRLKACRELGMKRVECIVTAALAEECLLIALGENECRQPLEKEDADDLRALLEHRHDYCACELDEMCPDWPNQPDCVRDMPLLKNIDEPYSSDKPLAAPADGALDTRAEDAPPEENHRSAHGYMRDDRLMINAVEEVVEQMRGAGVDARINVDGAGDTVKVEVSFPRICPAAQEVEKKPINSLAQEEPLDVQKIETDINSDDDLPDAAPKRTHAHEKKLRQIFELSAAGRALGMSASEKNSVACDYVPRGKKRRVSRTSYPDSQIEANEKAAGVAAENCDAAMGEGDAPAEINLRSARKSDAVNQQPAQPMPDARQCDKAEPAAVQQVETAARSELKPEINGAEKYLEELFRQEQCQLRRRKDIAVS